MAGGPFSSLPRRERFQACLIVVLIAAAILAFAIIIGIIISVRSQMSEANGATSQNSGVSVTPVNNANDLNPPAIWQAQTNGDSTMAATPLPGPAASATNAN